MSELWGASNANAYETNNGGFDTSDGLAEGDFAQDEAGRIQEDKVNKKRLAELEPDGKMIQIFVRLSRSSGLIPYTAVKDIPQSVATICSNLLFEKINKKGDRYYIIEGSNLAPYNFVFQWIKQCGEEQNVANMPEIKDLADLNTGLKPFIDIMLVAAKLKIPIASFNKFMIKKLNPLAREYLIDLPTVLRIFDSGDPEMYDLGLQEIAATSIFSHWYDYKLEDPEFDDYMYELSDMRDNIPELDDALHKAVEDKDAWLKNKRQERREKQAAEEAGADNSGFSDAGDAANSGGGGGDAAWSSQAVTVSGDDWAKKEVSDTNEWDKTESTADESAGWATENGAKGGDWADEMNGYVKPIPALAASTGGW